ncbi:MAG: FAD-dependent oxidoreductase [Verrucomicrobia bacterium]|nr:FAD-dependent oxidoreductase [Verrucomicrobiota bacterium]
MEHNARRDRTMKLFSPLKIGGLELANRIVMAPMGVSVAPPTGEITDKTFHYFLERARGGAGLIMLPSGGWARTDVAHPSVPIDRVPAYEAGRAEGHRRLAAELHEAGAKVGIQLQHRGRQATTHLFGYQPVAPSAVPWSPRAEVPAALSIPEIRNLVARYGRAAARAREIGFDLVEIHAAHGYLVSNFLSPESNQRDDEYGGGIEGRAKFLLEILTRIRSEVGLDFPISVRINGSDFTSTGLTIEDSIKISTLLERHGVDLISVSAGINGSYPLTIPPYYIEAPCFAELSKKIKNAINIPVVAAGRIHELDLAQRLLDENWADLIAIGRALLADPELPNKWKEGAEPRVRRCLSCNYCIDAYWDGGGGCVVNPAMTREKEFRAKPARRAKVIWVIGAGPAGMEAAWRASRRGHDVSLFEARGEPGGQWVLAAKPPGKEHFRSFLEYQWKEVQASGVKTHLGKKVEDREILEANPDAVILATGAEPVTPSIPGLEEAEQIGAWDVLNGVMPEGESYLVIGGGAVGLEVAHFLASRGKRVTLVEMQERLGSEMGDTLRWTLLRRLEKDGVKAYRSVQVTRADEDHVYVLAGGVEEKWQKFDVYVMATGLRSSQELERALSHFKGELHVIGDAKSPRRGADAVLEGARIGNSI